MLPEIASTPIREITLREPARARLDARMIDVVDTMRERHRGAVIVEDDGGRIVGIFTEADLLSRMDHLDHAWHTRAVRDVMTAKPSTLRMNTTITEALRRMHDGAFRHLPVIDDAGVAIGILSIRDILAHIVEFFPAEFINLPPDPDHEASRPWGG